MKGRVLLELADVSQHADGTPPRIKSKALIWFGELTIFRVPIGAGRTPPRTISASDIRGLQDLGVGSQPSADAQAIHMNERLLVAVAHSKAAVRVSANSGRQPNVCYRLASPRKQTVS